MTKANGITVDLADCTIIVKSPVDIGAKPNTSTIGIKFKVGDKMYGTYREYTPQSTFEDVCRDLVDMLNQKNEIIRELSK